MQTDSFFSLSPFFPSTPLLHLLPSLSFPSLSLLQTRENKARIERNPEKSFRIGELHIGRVPGARHQSARGRFETMAVFPFFFLPLSLSFLESGGIFFFYVLPPLEKM